MAVTPSLEQLSIMADALRGADLRTKSVESIKTALSEFLSGYSPIAIGRSSHQIWFRARLCSGPSGYSSLHEMIYPPSGCPDFGRAQLPGSSVLYASWNAPTALDEVGAQSGSHVQIIRLRPIEGVDIPCHVVGEYQKFHQSGGSLVNSEKLIGSLAQIQDANPTDFVRSVFIDSFISELFRYPAKRSFEYKITAAYSELLHLGAGGLIYPSVESLGAMNLAVPARVFDTKFEVVDTKVWTVEEAFGYGIYSLSPLRSSCDFDESGVIRWDSKMRRDFSWTPQTGIRERKHIAGWRKSNPDKR